MTEVNCPPDRENVGGLGVPKTRVIRSHGNVNTYTPFEWQTVFTIQDHSANDLST